MLAITPTLKTTPGITQRAVHAPKFRQEGPQPALAQFGYNTLSFGQKAHRAHHPALITPMPKTYCPVGARLDYYA